MLPLIHLKKKMRAALSRLSNIQILRAAAALMIVVYHCGIETARLAESSGHSKLFDETSWGLGVPLFFTISGFIMVVTTANSFGSAGATFDFLRRRIIRIVPLYWVLTTFVLALTVAAPNLTKTPAGDHLYVISSYLFWPYLCLSGYARPLVTPGWTLNLEMLFYATFAVALLFRQRTGMLVLFGSLGLLVTARVAGVLPGVALNFWGDPVILCFLSGAAVGVLYNNGVRLPWPWAMALLATGVCLIADPWRPTGLEDDFLPRLAWVEPSTMVLAALALGPQADGQSRLWQPVLLIGDASYGLYLIHEFLLRVLSIAWAKAALGKVMPLWTFVPIGIAVALAASVVVFWCFERPVTRWLQELSWAKIAPWLSPATLRRYAIASSNSPAWLRRKAAIELFVLARQIEQQFARPKAVPMLLRQTVA